MQYDDFIERIQERADLPSREAAERITRATLETLAARVQGDTANNAASQLPEELARSMRRAPGGDADRFGIDAFYQRVADRAGLPHDEAIARARIVLQELRAALAEGQVNHLWAELPGEFLTPFERPIARPSEAGQAPRPGA